MVQYTEQDVLRLAKRYNNAKRNYLLVNPLQAKHIPVSPKTSLEMMHELGNKVAKTYPNAKLVIGFAETATAIGAAVADCLSDDCIYICTTRETFDDAHKWVFFSEEHSHATEQRLCGDNLKEWISNSQQIIFVDDEISTGKTLVNIIKQLKIDYPDIGSKEIIAASIINRLNENNMVQISNAGLKSIFLVKLPEHNYSEIVDKFEVNSARALVCEKLLKTEYNTIPINTPIMDSRLGVNIREYFKNCDNVAIQVISAIGGELITNKRVLVLGTEECMMPALILGRKIEDMEVAKSVSCHSTTRSPIGVNSSIDYPIQNGFRLRSFYENERETYIYNLRSYDIVLVLTDAPFIDEIAAKELTSIMNQCGCETILYIEG